MRVEEARGDAARQPSERGRDQQQQAQAAIGDARPDVARGCAQRGGDDADETGRDGDLDVVAQEHAQQGHDDEAATDADHGPEPAGADGDEESDQRGAHGRTLTLAVVGRSGSTRTSIAGLPSGHGHVR
jgi:hypothetical protein